MKPKAIVCVGPSGSGKSTYAEDLVKQSCGTWAEVNRDYTRFQEILRLPAGVKSWDKWKFTKAKEQKVTQLCDERIELLAALDLNIIVSDTNLSPTTRNNMITKLEGLGYEVEIKPFPIDLKEAWKRDATRQGGVGHSVIYKQYLQMQEFMGRKIYEPDYTKPLAVLVDIDGTIAKMVNRGPFEWHKVGEDEPRDFVIDIVDNMHYSDCYEIIFLSGRDSVCREETEEWLNQHFGFEYSLFMRPEGSNRPDTEIKEKLFWDHVAPNYCVRGVVDDRPTVIRTWYELGIPNVISVGNPWVEF